MNLIYLKTFLTVCELGNFTEAAKHLFVPQPTVSNRMKSLEENLGQELFLKGRRGKRVVELTEAGEIFFPYAKKIIESMEHVKEKINASSNRGVLKLGSTIPSSHPLLYQYIKTLEEAIETISVEVFVKESEVISSFNSEDLDLAFVKGPLIDKNLECHLIKSEEIQLIVSANHPLAAGNHFSNIDYLEKEDIVIYSPLKNHLHNSEFLKLKYNRQIITNSFEIIRRLIIDNHWISFLPAQIMEREIERGDMVNLTIDEKFLIDHIKYFLVYRKNDTHEDLYQTVLQHYTLSSEHPQKTIQEQAVNS